MRPASPRSDRQKPRSRSAFRGVDKDKDGRIEKEEVFAPRRKAFAKLDTNGNGALSFEEWAAKSIDKFGGAELIARLADPNGIRNHRAPTTETCALRVLARRVSYPVFT